MQVQAGGIRAKALRATAMIGLLVITACAPVIRNHGYVPAASDLDLIEVGVSDRDFVADTVGRPSAAALLNDQGWYYVQSRWEHNGAYPPVETERRVVAITFREDGIVENVETFGIENGRVVALSRRVTETNIKSASFISQLFKNIGQFSPSDFIGKEEKL